MSRARRRFGARAAKAWTGAAATGLATLASGLGDNHLTSAEIVGAFAAAVAAFGAVYSVRNGRESDRTTSTPQA